MANTTADKLQGILDSKAAIKASIENKGIEVGEAPLSEYADKIDKIPSGGGFEWPTDDKTYFWVTVGGLITEPVTFNCIFSSGSVFSIEWGDGGRNEYRGTGSAQRIQHQFPVGKFRIAISRTSLSGTILLGTNVSAGEPFVGGSGLDILTRCYIGANTSLGVRSFYNNRCFTSLKISKFAKDASIINFTVNAILSCPRFAEFDAGDSAILTMSNNSILTSARDSIVLPPTLTALIAAASGSAGTLSIEFKNPTPVPAALANYVTGQTEIYVPDTSVDEYKANSAYYSAYANIILPASQKST